MATPIRYPRPLRPTSQILTQDLMGVAIDATGKVSISASLTATLQNLTAANKDAVVAVTLDSVGVTASGAVTGEGTVPEIRDAILAANLGDATLASAGALSGLGARTGNLSVTLEGITPTIAGAITGYANLTGSLSATLETATAVSSGTVTGGAPAPSVGDLAVTLGTATLIAAGTAPVTGDLAVTLGTATLAADGTVTAQAPVTGDLAVTLGTATVTADGTVTGATGRTGDLAVTLGTATVASEGTVASGGGGTLWTPANLAVQPRLAVRHRNATWASATSLSSLPNAGTDMGDNSGALFGQDGVSQGTTIKGFPLIGLEQNYSKVEHRLSAMNPDAITVIAVVRLTQQNANGLFNGPNGWTAADTVGIYSRVSGLGQFGCGNGYTGSNAPRIENAFNLPAGQLSIQVWRLGGLTDLNLARCDGTTIAHVVNRVGPITSYVAGTWKVGLVGGGEGLRGQVADLYFFDYPLTQDEIEKFEGWAAHEYGTTAQLPANHPYKTNPPYV